MSDNNKALVTGNGSVALSVNEQQIASIFEGMLTPFLDKMGRFFEQQSRAMEHLAATQAKQSERMDGIEQQIRLNTLVTPQQVRYFNSTIKAKAKEQLEKKEIQDATAMRQISNMIRKSVLVRFGVSALHEIPRCEYNVVLTQVQTWSDLIGVREIANQAKERLSKQK